MKRGSIPLWLLRDLPALIGVAWSFWPLMILVISSGRRAMRGKQVHRSVYDALMQMLPIAEARLRFALHRQAYRVLGWNPRAITLDPVDPVASWSDFRVRFEAYRASMTDLHASAAFFLNEDRRLHRIRTRVDANAVHAAHGSTDALRAAHHEAVGVSPHSNRFVALMLSSDRLAAPKRSGGGRERPSKHERVLTHARGPPPFPTANRQLPTASEAPASGIAPPCPIKIDASTRALTIRRAARLTTISRCTAGIRARPRRTPVNIHPC